MSNFETINRFVGDYAFLSNFYPSPILYAGKSWPTVEHLFQAAKTLDEDSRERIRVAKLPGKAKKLGRAADLRKDWEEVKEAAMLACVRRKFKQNVSLGRLLLKTRNMFLVEGNTWHDNFWGDCCCHRCESIVGKNRLGEILMQVRDELLDGGGLRG